MLGFGKKLAGMRVAIVTTDGVEHTELTGPWKALKKAGAEVYVIGPRLRTLQTVKKLMQADRVPVDGTVDEVRAAAFNGLVLPGSTLTFKERRARPARLGLCGPLCGPASQSRRSRRRRRWWRWLAMSPGGR